jgi:LVIVD repeat
MRILLLLLITGLLVSCDPETGLNQDAMLEAYVPVYAKPADLTAISTEAAQPTTKAGKIYAYGNYIFQNDQQKGIHIIDNSVPATAHKVAFLKIPFTTEIAIRNNFLYTNSVSDLLVFNIADPLHPALVKRVTNAFPLINQEYPPVSNIYFECPDPSKGIIVDWEVKLIGTPKCRR